MKWKAGTKTLAIVVAIYLSLLIVIILTTRI
jgi:hypothetical protein